MLRKMKNNYQSLFEKENSISSIDRKFILKGTMKLFVPAMVLSMAITIVILVFTKNSIQNEIQRDEWRLIETILNGIDSDLKNTATNLAYLANHSKSKNICGIRMGKSMMKFSLTLRRIT